MRKFKTKLTLIRLFGGFTKEYLQEVFDEEKEIQTNHTYYTITNNEELRKEKLDYLDFIFWKIFTRLSLEEKFLSNFNGKFFWIRKLYCFIVGHKYYKFQGKKECWRCSNIM